MRNTYIRYTPSNSIRQLLEELVKQPYENHRCTPAWVKHVLNIDSDRRFDHHREILNQGRTDFDEPFNGLPPEDKVLLYCIYYMPMHLASSHHIFRIHEPVFTTQLRSADNKVIFIDFGCGPLTSGLAFHETGWQGDISYLGIESSQSMRDKATEINQYSPRFSRFELISDYSQLPNLLEDVIAEDDKTPIIFNFCYFLASETLDIRHLSDVMAQIGDKYCNHNLCIVYQNPPRSELHNNWESLKAHLTGFRSIVRSSSHNRPFSYNTLTDERTLNRTVYYDILCNW